MTVVARIADKEESHYRGVLFEEFRLVQLIPASSVQWNKTAHLESSQNIIIEIPSSGQYRLFTILCD